MVSVLQIASDYFRTPSLQDENAWLTALKMVKILSSLDLDHSGPKYEILFSTNNWELFLCIIMIMKDVDPLKMQYSD